MTDLSAQTADLRSRPDCDGSDDPRQRCGLHHPTSIALLGGYTCCCGGYWTRLEVCASGAQAGEAVSLEARLEAVLEYTMPAAAADISTHVEGVMTVLRPVLDKQTAEIARLREAVAHYENTLTWQTTCHNCARLLDSCYAETMRAERYKTAWASARIGRAKLREELDCQLCLKSEREQERKRADRAEARAESAETERDEFKSLVRELVDREPCEHFDHHGGCQTHGGSTDCPDGRAQALLALDQPEEGS